MDLSLHILAQAIEDVLRFELNLPLEGADTDAEEIYEQALEFIARYPTLMARWRAHPNKNSWLNEVINARDV